MNEHFPSHISHGSDLYDVPSKGYAKTDVIEVLGCGWTARSSRSGAEVDRSETVPLAELLKKMTRWEVHCVYHGLNPAWR